MVKNGKKIWAHYETLKGIIGYYIGLFCTIPILSMCFSCLASSKAIDSGAPDAIKVALLSGLGWAAIIIVVITILFIIWALFYTDTVVFSNTSIKYYRWPFSKDSREISYDEITECVFNDGLWWHKGQYKRGRKIWIYNKNKVILELELYYKLCLVIALTLRDKKIRVVADNLRLKTINNYFKIEFMNLSCEQQLAILKYYCKLARGKYRTGEEILRKEHKIAVEVKKKGKSV